MAHNNLSSNFLDQTDLFTKIKAKIVADGSTGPVIGFLADNLIDLTIDATAKTLAITNNTNFLAYTQTSQNQRELRDNAMMPVVVDIKNIFQFLKIVKVGNKKSAGDWGAPISNSGKITYPTDPVELMALLTAIKTKHDTYTPPTSPLAIFLTENKISLTDDAATVVIVLAKNVLANDAKIAAENSRQLRDNGWAPVYAHVQSIVDFLTALYPNNSKELAFYGIIVITDTRVVKEKIVSIPFNGSKLGIRGRVGSIIVNKGTESLFIYPGKSLDGTPIELAAGEKLILAKGFGTFSIGNSSALKNGSLLVNPY